MAFSAATTSMAARMGPTVSVILRLLLVLVLATPFARAQPPDSNSNIPLPGPDDPVLAGYDLVAYHSLEPLQDGVPGSPDISHRYNGYLYYFASQENKQAFVSNPTKYLPKYGGFCAWGMAWEYPEEGWPWAANHMGPPCGPRDGWAILDDGRLYCSIWRSYQDDFNRRQQEGIRLADERWIEFYGSLEAGPQNNGCYAWNWQECFARSIYVPSDDDNQEPTPLPNMPTSAPTKAPTTNPTNGPTERPTSAPITGAPTVTPGTPTKAPTPTLSPTEAPTNTPTNGPTKAPTKTPLPATPTPTTTTTTTPTAPPTGSASAPDVLFTENFNTTWSDEQAVLGGNVTWKWTLAHITTTTPKLIVEMTAAMDEEDTNTYVAFGVAEQLMQGALVVCAPQPGQNVSVQQAAVESVCQTLIGAGMGTSVPEVDPVQPKVLESYRNESTYVVRFSAFLFGCWADPRLPARVLFARGLVSGNGDPQPHLNDPLHRQAVTGIEFLSVVDYVEEDPPDFPEPARLEPLPARELWNPVSGTSGAMEILEGRILISYELFQFEQEDILLIELQNVEFGSEETYVGFGFAEEVMTGLVMTCAPRLDSITDTTATCQQWRGQGTNLYPLSSTTDAGGWFLMDVVGDGENVNYTLAGRATDVIPGSGLLSADHLRAICAVGRSAPDSGTPLIHQARDRTSFQLERLVPSPSDSPSSPTDSPGDTLSDSPSSLPTDSTSTMTLATKPGLQSAAQDLLRFNVWASIVSPVLLLILDF